MSYVVSQVSLLPISGVHEGTGTHTATNWVVDPASVPGSAPLVFTGYTGEMLFAIADNVVPNWFGVAVPHGLTDVTHAHIFFHPTPLPARFCGNWPPGERRTAESDGRFPTEAAPILRSVRGLWRSKLRKKLDISGFESKKTL